MRAQPSAEIVRVECVKCRKSAICPVPAQPSAESVRVEREMQASTGDFVVQL